MSLQNRRRWMRWCFAMACALPTLIFGGAAAIRHTQWNRQRMAQSWGESLTRRLGVSVAVANWTETWNGQNVLEGVVLRDPESDEELGRCASLLVEGRDGRTLIVANGLELCAGNADSLLQATHERILRGPDTPDWKGLLVAESAVIRLGDEALTVRDLRCSYVGGQMSRSAIFEFGLAWYDRTEPIRCEVLRQREGVSPMTHWKLDCQASPLPCRVLAAWGWDPWVGATAEFAGVAQGSFGSSSDAVAQARGVVSRVDLAALTRGPRGRGAGMYGSAQVRLDQAVWRRGVLVQALGRCDAKKGMAEPRFLQALAQGLRTRRLQIDDASQRIPWSELHGAFRLEHGSLLVRGDCGQFGGVGDALLAGNDRMILASEGYQAPLASLIHHLAPLSHNPFSFAAALPAPASGDNTVRVAAD